MFSCWHHSCLQNTVNFSFLKGFNLLFSLLTATWRHNMNRNRKLLVIRSWATEKQISGLFSPLIAQICSVACRQLLMVEDTWHHLWWNVVNKKCNYERRFVVWPCGKAAQYLLKVFNDSIICFSYAPIGQNIKTTEGWRDTGDPHQHCSVLIKCGFQMGSSWRTEICWYSIFTACSLTVPTSPNICHISIIMIPTSHNGSKLNFSASSTLPRLRRELTLVVISLTTWFFYVF